MTQVELATSSGVSTATLREMQNARIPRRRSSRTLAAISTALQWPSDHLEHLASNGEAPGQPIDRVEALAARVDDLTRRLEAVESRLP
jgi:hypothetical protein